MIKNYEDQPIKDGKGNVLEIRTILFSPTGKSEANPIYTTWLKRHGEVIVLDPR